MKAYLILIFSFIGIFLFLPSGASAAVAWFDDAFDVTPSSASAWVDVDNVNVPNGAEGVILHFVVTGTLNNGFRNNGSTDNRHPDSFSDSYWTSVGVDANGIFEVWVESTSNIKVWLVGYYAADFSNFFTNAIDKSLASSGSYIDVDISGDDGTDTAIGAMIEVTASGFNGDWGIRNNGSTDTSGAGDINQRSAGIIGVDGSQIFEGDVSTTGIDFFLMGYAISDSTWLVNSTDLNLDTTGAWTDLDALPAGATGAFLKFECASSCGDTYGLRRNGSSEDIRPADANTDGTTFGIVEGDASRILEGWTSSLTRNFELVGYPTTIEIVVVHTDPATVPLATTATLNANLLSLEGVPDADVFFEYGTSSGVYTASTTPVTKSSTGTFSADVTGLTTEFQYFYRAAYTASSTEGVGGEVTFWTIPWKDTDFGFREVIEIDNTNVGSDLSAFPYLVLTSLSNSTSTISTNAEENGIDFIFTDVSGTTLDWEREKYASSTGALAAWVEMPTVLTASNTALVMYFGKSGATDTSSSTAVFDSNYQVVHHLSEASGNVADSTSNARTGTANGGLTYGTSAIGDGLTFDEIDAEIITADFDYTDTFTWSIWEKVSASGGSAHKYVWSHGGVGTHPNHTMWLPEPGSNATVRIFGQTSGSDDLVSSSFTPSDQSWHYIVVNRVRNGTSVLYGDGVSVDTEPTVDQDLDPTGSIYYGTREDHESARFFGGVLDEFRISSVTRTVDWTLFEYHNQLPGGDGEADYKDFETAPVVEGEGDGAGGDGSYIDWF